jgi:hypothetical protein
VDDLRTPVAVAELEGCLTRRTQAEALLDAYCEARGFILPTDPNELRAYMRGLAAFVAYTVRNTYIQNDKRKAA